MADEEFHEIQLNGKQLVFLFMAGTVAAVVIFLSGLMVGRNIRSPRVEAAAAPAEATVIDPTRPPDDVPPPTTTPESSTPVSVNETLTYSEQLEGPTPPADDDLAPPKPAPKVAERTVEKPVKPAVKPGDKPANVATSTKPAAAAPESTTTSEPPGNGWAVQVQAVKTRTEADAIARRLNAKGYPTFVTMRAAGLYGVRVGKFPNKRDAEAVKARLEKDEQFKPWVTR
jgi:cell division septation protein DedD